MRPAATAAAVAMAVAAAGAQAPLDTIVQRAAQYVADYQAELAMVVSEERYEQEVRYPRAVPGRLQDFTQSTVLRSDFLLVRNADGSWLPFRDVFERDRQPVRDRDERLARLFLGDPATASEQARRITAESARYNLGEIDRTVNVPTLALLFLTDSLRDGFAFADAGRDDGLRIVSYREVRRPTYISTTGGRDLPVSGRFWIDEATGRIERTEVVADDEDLEARISVTYRDDPDAKLWVPVRMEERYLRKSDRLETRGLATYARFRRFAISTREDLATDEAVQ